MVDRCELAGRCRFVFDYERLDAFPYPVDLRPPNLSLVSHAGSNGGSFTYALDGGPAATIMTSPTPTISTQNGGTTGRGVVRLADVSAGLHTISITVTSATSASNSVSIGGIGTGSSPADKDISSVYVGGVTKQRLDGNGAATARYNSDALAVVNTLAGDGLKAFFVPVRNFIDGQPSQMFDQLHPNDVGHGLPRDAFESVW
jgi:hypothetical protein